MPKRRRRSRVGVLLDILSALAKYADQPASRIAMYANLPYDRLKPLLDDLESKGLIERVENDPKTVRYRLTPKGYTLLRELQRLRRLLEDFDLDVL